MKLSALNNKQACLEISLFTLLWGVFLQLLELEEILSVVVADIFNHLTYALHLTIGYLAIFYIAAYEVAESAAEVFVAGV